MGVNILRGHQVQFQIAPDDREQIVEVVRHSARQLADPFHFLGLAKLLFYLLAPGYVLGYPGDMVNCPCFIADGGPTGMNPADLVVRADDPVFEIEIFPPVYRLHRRQRPGAVFLMD